MTDQNNLHDLQQALEAAEQQLIQSEARIVALKKVLSRVPHASGDHTDLCRMKNAGLPPRDYQHCCCHVALVRQVLYPE